MKYIFTIGIVAMSLFVIRKAFEASDIEEESIKNDTEGNIDNEDDDLFSNKLNVDTVENDSSNKNNLNQFEALEQAIQKASFILIELENLMPIESRNGFDPGYRPLRIDDEIFLNNSDLILSFPLKLQSVDEEFNLLVDKMRYFGIVVNQLEHVGVIIKITRREFKKIYEDDFNESYIEYLQLIEHYSDRLKKYEQLRGTISELIIHDILDQLKAR